MEAQPADGTGGGGGPTAAEAEAIVSADLVVDDSFVCSAAKNTAVALGDEVRGYGSEEVRAISCACDITRQWGSVYHTHLAEYPYLYVSCCQATTTRICYLAHRLRGW